MRAVSADVIWLQSQIHVISSELRYPSPWRHIHALRGADQLVQKVPSRDGHPRHNLRIVQSRCEINGPAAQCIWQTGGVQGEQQVPVFRTRLAHLA